MNQQELNHLLNKNKNFHLTLKVIQFVDNQLLNDFSNYLDNFQFTFIKITNFDDAYELLRKAYEEKMDYVLCNDCIACLLPLICVINQENFDIVKPFIPVYYLLKDNRIIQNLKTYCRKKMATFIGFKYKEDLFKNILLLINE